MARLRSSISSTSLGSPKMRPPAVTTTSQAVANPPIGPFWSFLQAVRSNIIIVITRYIVKPVFRAILLAILPKSIVNLLNSQTQRLPLGRSVSGIDPWVSVRYLPSAIFNAGVQAIVTYYLATIVYPCVLNLFSNTHLYWSSKAPNYGAGQYFKQFLVVWFFVDIIQQYITTLPLLACWVTNPLLTLNCWRHPNQNWVLESWHPTVSELIIVERPQTWRARLGGGFALGGITTLFSVLVYGRPFAGNTAAQPGAPPTA